MKHVRQPWMIRAAVGVILVGLILIVFSVAWMWLYRQVADVAPEWMLVEGGRGGSALGRAGMLGYMLIGGLVGLFATLGLFRLLRVPNEVFAPAGRAGDYPFYGRPLPPEARTQTGQEGFAGKTLDQFSRNPLTPPARKPD